MDGFMLSVTPVLGLWVSLVLVAIGMSLDFQAQLVWIVLRKFFLIPSTWEVHKMHATWKRHGRSPSFTRKKWVNRNTCLSHSCVSDGQQISIVFPVFLWRCWFLMIIIEDVIKFIQTTSLHSLHGFVLRIRLTLHDTASWGQPQRHHPRPQCLGHVRPSAGNHFELADWVGLLENLQLF